MEDREVICAGSWIARNFVLTAAHCVENLSLAMVSEFRDGSWGPTYFSSVAIIHGNYSGLPHDFNDIAILKTYDEHISSYMTLARVRKEAGVAPTMHAWGNSSNDSAPERVPVHLHEPNTARCQKLTDLEDGGPITSWKPKSKEKLSKKERAKIRFAPASSNIVQYAITFALSNLYDDDESWVKYVKQCGPDDDESYVKYVDVAHHWRWVQ